MSRRQYIGARYVPKFFDWDGSTEWRSGVTYEALTIVTRNGYNYTSKIPVPSNIGEPENNPEYWVVSGMSSEQIESIRQDLTSAQGDITELKEELSAIANEQITQVNATKDSTKLTAYPTRGYINSANGELYPNNNYQIYYYIVNAEGDVWFESNTKFCQFAVYRGTILTASSLQVLYKNDSANFPLSANKYSALQVGDIVAICIQVGSSHDFTYYFPFYEGYLLNDDTVENIGERLGTDEIKANLLSQGNDISDLKNSIIEMPSHDSHMIWGDDGITVNNNSGYDSTNLIEIQKGSKIIYNTNIPSGYHALLFYDDNGVIAGTYGTNQSGNDFTYIVEDESYKYVRYQSRNLNFSGNTIAPSIKIYQPIIDLITSVKSPLYLSYISTSEFHIKVPCKSGKYVRYVFRHDYKKWDSLEYEDENGNTHTATNVVSCDLWNNYEVYNDTDNTYIAQGNTNFIVERGNHYIGDGHGNEVEISFVILADGKEIDLTAMRPGQSLACGEIRIISKSKMYRFGGNTGSDVPGKAYPALDTSGSPIVELLHCMDISYSYNNLVKWNNKIVVQNDNISFGCCFGAMLECYYADFDTVIIDNAENTQNDIANDGTVTVHNGSVIDLHTSGNNTQFASVVEMFGKDFYVKQAMKNIDASTRGKQAVAFSFYADRLKAYFAPVRTTSRYPSGYTADVFNSGDVIAVENERIIEI